MNESAGETSPAESAQFQRREWTAQRLGWAVLWVALLAGGAGIFGRGPMARAHASDGRGWRMDYERFARNRTPTTLTVTIPAEGRRGDTATVWLDREYADNVEIERVTPEPAGVAVEPGRLIYHFLAPRADGSVRVGFDLEPRSVGRLRGRAGSLDSRGIAFSQMVYP